MYNLDQPNNSESAANKANKDGTGLTNPATWRGNLDVPVTAEARRMAAIERTEGLAFLGVASTKVQAATRQTIGTGPVSLWARFRVPSTLSTTRGIAALGPDVSYILGSGGNSIGLIISGGVGDVCVVMGDGTNWTRYPLGLAAKAGQIVDVVITRTGSTLAGYVNGDAVTLTGTATGTGCAASASITSTYISLAGAATSAATSTFDGAIYRCAAFNRALSAGEVPNLIAYGIEPADQWGSTTAAYASAFGAGVASGFGANAGNTVAGIAGPIGGVSGVLQVSSGATTGDSTDGSQLVSGRRYRIDAMVYVPAANATGVKVAFETSGGTTFGVSVTPPDDTWTALSGEVLWPATTTGMRFRLRTAGDSTTITAGDQFYLDDVTATRIGAFVDYDFGVGVGLQFTDRSSNVITADATGTVEHVAPRRWGTCTVTRVLAHSDISATAGTTKVLDLAPNCALVGVEFDRTAAFDVGVTLDIGTAGSATKFVGAQSVASTGIVRVASSDLASQSNSAWTSVFAKKSSSSTTGAVTLRLTIEIRG